MTGEKTRLCIVSPTHWKAFMGGAQYQIKCILDALMPKKRYDIHYMARRVPPGFVPTGYELIKIGRGTGVPKLGYLADALPLYRGLRAVRPDVIYQRVGCGYTGIATFYARRHGARIIWHVAHDSDVEPGRDIGSGNPVRQRLEKRSIEYAIRHADHIVTQTEHQAALLLRHYGRTADAVIPNFHPLPTEIVDKSGPVTVLWVANLKPWKQPEPFIRLAATLRDLPEVRFLMVGAEATGAGDREWNEAVMRSIVSVPNLEYLGPRTQEEVNALLARAHVFVNTSLAEGFANTFIQAWMREVPVVTLHVNPDAILEREKVGIHAGTEARLAEAVRLLVTDAAVRSGYAGRARAYALARHSSGNADRLAALIDRGRVRA